MEIREIRSEEPSDHAAVEAVHDRAFGGKNEAAVVRAIRESAGYRPEWSLVCEDCAQITGHVLFSHVGLEDKERATRQIVVLAPLAVLPEKQRRGVGLALVQQGLALLESVSVPLVVVRGDLAYYGQFGFQPSSEFDIHAPFAVAEDHYLVKGLLRYATAYRGIVRYPAAFAAVGYEAQWKPSPRPASSASRRSPA